MSQARKSTKVWGLAFFAVLLGLSLGTLSALLEADAFSTSPLEVELSDAGRLERPDLPALPSPHGPQPRLVVDSPHFYFGRMERKATGRHTFVLKNVGDFPLVLRKGKTSCKCTLSELNDTEVPPGGSTEVTLEWTAKTYESLFRQDATIFTNDPRRQIVTLTIEGLVIDSLQVNPPEVVFSNLTADESSSAKTRVFTSLADELKIVGHTCDNKETADLFDVSSEALPKDAMPTGMLSGVEVTVSIKPGLPPGSIQQKIFLQTNLPQEVPDAEIKIGGRIGSPILVVGREWDQDKGVVRLGTIDSAKGTTRQLKLMIRGQHRQEIELEAPQVRPELLKVTLGKREELGNVIAVPLTIEIPPGSPAMNYLGYTPEGTGEIIIPTTQPELGEVRMKVTFAVSGK